MKPYYSILLVALSLFLASAIFTQTSNAQCVVVGATPEGGEEVVCTGNVVGDLTTTNLADDVTINGANISGVEDAIETLDGDDNITMTGGSITGMVGINSGGDADNINITGGNFNNSDECVNASAGNGDIITIDNATFNCTGEDGVTASSGNGDQIIVSNVIITANDNAIDAGSGNNDEITIGDNVLLFSTAGEANINCGSGSNDSLTFAMVVSAEDFDFLSAQIAAGGTNGEIVINGFPYEWQSCEVLINDLKIGIPIINTRPIPTLSEWGMIAMAVILGVFGVIVARRRFQSV